LGVVRVTVLVVVGLLFLYTAPTTAIFWTLFLVWAAFRLDSRMIGMGALALLVCIPIVLSLGEEEWGWLAEQLAVYVFFLLCITVGLQIIELILEPRDTADLTEQSTSPHQAKPSKTSAPVPDYTLHTEKTPARTSSPKHLAHRRPHPSPRPVRSPRYTDIKRPRP
jgi:carbon starvation protein CstA